MNDQTETPRMHTLSPSASLEKLEPSKNWVPLNQEMLQQLGLSLDLEWNDLETHLNKYGEKSFLLGPWLEELAKLLKDKKVVPLESEFKSSASGSVDDVPKLFRYKPVSAVSGVYGQILYTWKDPIFDNFQGVDAPIDYMLDLLVPFWDSLKEKNGKIEIILVSGNLDKVKSKLEARGWTEEEIGFQSFPIEQDLSSDNLNLKVLQTDSDTLVHTFYAQIPQDQEVTLISAPQNENLLWAQDYFAAFNLVQGEEEELTNIFLPPVATESRPIKWQLFNQLETQSSNINYLHSEYLKWDFEGGNILVGGDFMLVGAKKLDNLEAASLEALKESFSDGFMYSTDNVFPIGADLKSVWDQLETDTLDEALLFIDDNFDEGLFADWQFLYHLDLFITLAGKAQKLGKERVVVGEIVHQEGEEVLDGVAKLWNAQLQLLIDQCLPKEKFEVFRCPLAITWMWNQDQTSKIWYFASYNNCLIQQGHQNTVWVPTYGHGSWLDLKQYDDENKGKWESLGFEVIELGDVHPLAVRYGGVRCITKCIKRN